MSDWKRIETVRGARVSVCHVRSQSNWEDFGTASFEAGGIEASVHPLTADDCEKLAAHFADLAMSLRAANVGKTTRMTELFGMKELQEIPA